MTGAISDNGSSVANGHDVKGLCWSNAQEARRLPRPQGIVDVGVQVQVGETVRVVREEDLFALQERFDGLQSLVRRSR